MEEKLEFDGPIVTPGDYGFPIPRELMLRELGFNGPFSRYQVGKAFVSHTLKTKAVRTLCTKPLLKKQNFKLPLGSRTTFHMAFSPDGTKVASCHGDHNVYVTSIATLKVVKTLSGHPRTPWCVVFHPTQNDILASGCLAGHVRVWDLNGGSELLVCDTGTVIASLSFHPTVRLLAVATFNEILFWDWAMGPIPLVRCSTGSLKEKVRLVRFDRLGHSILTGITNFPGPPGNDGIPISESDPNRPGTRSYTSERPLRFFRPNILSRTPHPTSASARRNRIPAQQHDDVDLDLPIIPEGPVDSPGETEAASVAVALNERQQRFQASYRQLVNHYEDLVQHYQQFIRTRLHLTESAVALDFPTSDSNPTSPDTPGDSPPVDIVVSENPASLPSDLELNPPEEVVIVDNEVPGPSSRLYPPGNPDPDPSTNNVRLSPNGNNSHLRSIQALEQNIVEMQNLCSQARRDSSNFPVETVHIQELRTIRRHLEILQDQTRQLQTSIRETLSTLAQGTAGPFEFQSVVTNQSGRTSVPPDSRVRLERSQNQSRLLFRPTLSGSSSGLDTDDSNNTASPSPPPAATPSREPGRQSVRREPEEPINSFQDLIGRTVQNAFNRSSTDDFTPYELPRELQEQSIPDIVRPQDIEPGDAATGRVPREIIPEVQSHARYCPYSDGNTPRPTSRLRTLVDMGETPILAVWPTVDVGQELAVRSFRIDVSTHDQANSVRPSRTSIITSTSHVSQNRSNQAGEGVNFPSFGNWMGQGPNWMQSDLGVRVYLTVRQVNDRLNIIRSRQDELATEREQMSRRSPASVPPRTEQVSRDPEQGNRSNGGLESWQRNFSSGVALLPSSVREGLRQYRRRPLFYRPIGEGDHGYARPIPVRTIPVNSLESRQNGIRAGSLRREPPSRLQGNFMRSTYMRIGDDFVPVYSHLRDRDVLQQNIFVLPTGLFLEGSGWTTNSIAIYWPYLSREEEESLAEYRRNENLIPVITPDAERVMDHRISRYCIDYDENQVIIHVAHGFALTFIQPGLTLLDAVTTLANFPRPRENSGTVYVTHVSPLLDAIERLFGYRRRREPGYGTFGPQIPIQTFRYFQPTGNNTAGNSASGNVSRNLNQAGTTAGQRRLGEWPSRFRPVSQSNTTEMSDERPRGSTTIMTYAEAIPASAASLANDLRRLRRDAWDSSIQPETNQTLGSTAIESQTGRQADMRWRNSGNYGEPIPPNYVPGDAGTTGESDSASLASTRRVIRLAVATAASNVLRRGNLVGDFRVYENNPSRAIESRIERVLNERGNRGIGEDVSLPSFEGYTYVRPNPPSFPDSDAMNASLRESEIRTIEWLGSNESEQQRITNGRVGIARLLRRSYAMMEVSDSEEEEMVPRQIPRISRSTTRGSIAPFRRRPLRSPDYRVRSQSRQVPPNESQASASAISSSITATSTSSTGRQNNPTYVEYRPRETSSNNNNNRRHPLSPPLEMDRYEWRRFIATPREHVAQIPPGDLTPRGGLPVSINLRRDPRNSQTPAREGQAVGVHSPGMPISRYFRRVPYPTQDHGHNVAAPEEPVIGARFYPGYIPEIIITPRPRPPHHYTLDASTTAFLSSRIQKWDFSSFQIPNLEEREESIVVRECSLHSDACLDLSMDGDFVAVCIPSHSGSYSAIGLYSVRDESLGDMIHIFHFEQNTVSVSIAPSGDYIVVGYAGRGGPLYRFVHQTRSIGQILSLTRGEEGGAKLVPIKELFADTQNTMMSVNCMHFFPIPGYGIIYGTNTGELVLLS